MKGLQAILHQVEAKYAKGKKVDFKPGDSVKVHLKVKEGEKERVQVYEGVVVSRGKGGIQETFRVRRISYGVGVERMFPVHSPSIVKIDVTKRGVAARAKLYYLKGKSGKDARIAERRATDASGASVGASDVVAETAEQKVKAAAAEAEKAARVAAHEAKSHKAEKAPEAPSAEKKEEAKA
jgi:large subunit ribosomal protein L19